MDNGWIIFTFRKIYLSSSLVRTILYKIMCVYLIQTKFSSSILNASGRGCGPIIYSITHYSCRARYCWRSNPFPFRARKSINHHHHHHHHRRRRRRRRRHHILPTCSTKWAAAAIGGPRFLIEKPEGLHFAFHFSSLRSKN